MFYIWSPIRGRNRKGLLSGSKIIRNQTILQERRLKILFFPFSSSHVAPAGKVHPQTGIPGPDRNRKWGHRGALQRGLRRRGRLRWLRRRRAPEKHPKSLQMWVSSSCNLSDRQLINLSKAPEHNSSLRRFGGVAEHSRTAKWECDATMTFFFYFIFLDLARGLVWILICTVMCWANEYCASAVPEAAGFNTKELYSHWVYFPGKKNTPKKSQWWWNTSNQNDSRCKHTRKKKYNYNNIHQACGCIMWTMF